MSDIGSMSPNSVTELQIYNIENNTLKIAWSTSIAFDKGAFENVHWFDENTLSFSKSSGNHCDVKPVIVSIIDGKWQLISK